MWMIDSEMIVARKAKIWPSFQPAGSRYGLSFARSLISIAGPMKKNTVPVYRYGIGIHYWCAGTDLNSYLVLQKNDLFIWEVFDLFYVCLKTYKPEPLLF
jgi:hypothetical protein